MARFVVLEGYAEGLYHEPSPLVVNVESIVSLKQGYLRNADNTQTPCVYIDTVRRFDVVVRGSLSDVSNKINQVCGQAEFCISEQSIIEMQKSIKQG